MLGAVNVAPPSLERATKIALSLGVRHAGVVVKRAIADVDVAVGLNGEVAPLHVVEVVLRADEAGTKKSGRLKRGPGDNFRRRSVVTSEARGPGSSESSGS
jgi:hypothetical protein